ncbi:MAG: hypothetical protein ACRDR6_21705 [Pseudonocardiaceae bacterium]
MIDQRDTPGCPHSELAVGWALHVLEPAEESLVTEHLMECAACTRIVAETEQVGVALGLSMSEVATPSPELERRVLAITTTAQAPPVMSPAPPTRPAPPKRPAAHIAPKATDGSLATPTAAPLWRAPRPRPGREPFCVPEIVKLLMVALLVAVIAVLIVFYLV